MQDVVEALITTLRQIYQEIYQCKKLGKRLRFGGIMATSL